MRLAPPAGTSLDSLFAWARRVTDDINRSRPTIDSLPSFADDSEAANSNLKVGQPYVDPEGIVRRRVS